MFKTISTAALLAVTMIAFTISFITSDARGDFPSPDPEPPISGGCSFQDNGDGTLNCPGDAICPPRPESATTSVSTESSIPGQVPQACLSDTRQTNPHTVVTICGCMDDPGEGVPEG